MNCQGAEALLTKETDKGVSGVSLPNLYHLVLVGLLFKVSAKVWMPQWIAVTGCF